MEKAKNPKTKAGGQENKQQPKQPNKAQGAPRTQRGSKNAHDRELQAVARLESQFQKYKKQHPAKTVHSAEQGRKEVKPLYKRGAPEQKQNVQQVLSAWDRMTVAKHFPGQLDTEYVAGMNVTSLPTMSLGVSGTIDKAFNLDTGQMEALGACTYTFLGWCPIATAFRGSGEPGDIPAADKLGGMLVLQTNDLDTQIGHQSMFSIYQAHTMDEVYGSDMSGFTAGGFVWSSELKMNILCPAANLIGSSYRGSVLFGQLPSKVDPLTPWLTVRDFLEIGTDTLVMDPQQHLRAAVVNHNVVYDSQAQEGVGMKGAQFVGELVSYLIFQTPVASITDAAPMKFTLQTNIRGNAVFWAEPRDSLANNIFKRIEGASTDPMPNMLKGVQQNTEMKPKKVGSFWEGAKHLMKQAWKHRGPIMNVAKHVMSGMGLPIPFLAAETRCVAIKCNYLKSLDKSLCALNTLQLQNPTMDIRDFYKTLQEEILRVQKIHDRVIYFTSKEDDTKEESDDDYHEVESVTLKEKKKK